MPSTCSIHTSDGQTVADDEIDKNCFRRFSLQQVSSQRNRNVGRSRGIVLVQTTMGTLKATDELLPTTRRMRSHCWISCDGCLSEQDSAPSAHPLIVLDRLEWQELTVVDSTVEHQDPTTHNNDIGSIISGSNCYLLQKWRRLLWWPSPAIPTRQDSMSRAVQIGCSSPIGGDHHSLIRKVKLCLRWCLLCRSG